MRVFCLAAPGRVAGALTAHAFIDAELHALAAEGVHIDILHRPDRPIGGIDGVRAWPMTRPWPLPRGFARALLTAAPRLVAAPSRSILRAVAIEAMVADIITASQSDLIHSHFGWPGGSGGAVAATLAGVPLVASLRGMDLSVAPRFSYGQRLARPFDVSIRHMLKRADRTLFFSDFMRRQAVELGAVPSRTRMVPKAVDSAHFRPLTAVVEAKARYAAGRPLAILWTGGLLPMKRPSLALRCVAPLLRPLDAELIFCGEGVEREQVRSLADSLGIGEYVSFLGRIPRDEMPHVYAAADLLLHTAILESSPNVFLEALACARPVVCAAGGGAAEFVRHEETGLIVPPDDEKGITDAVRQLLIDPDRRTRMGQAGRATMVQRHARQIETRSFLSVYSEVAPLARARR
jgi:glycosyltransferase involved in cell wall biosynthesis